MSTNLSKELVQPGSYEAIQFVGVDSGRADSFDPMLGAIVMTGPGVLGMVLAHHIEITHGNVETPTLTVHENILTPPTVTMPQDSDLSLNIFRHSPQSFPETGAYQLPHKGPDGIVSLYLAGGFQ